MKNYKVKYTRIIRSNIEVTVEVSKKEEIEAILKRRESCFDIEINSIKEVPAYSTKKWRSLEDVIRNHEQNIRERGLEMDDIYVEDLKDLNAILSCLIDGDIKGAAEKYQNVDTAVREYIPDDIYDLFDSMELI